MAYSSKLEVRLARKVTKAIKTFDLFEEGVHVMVGLSGGKDSWTLMQVLEVLRRHASINFSLIAVNVDSWHEEYTSTMRSHTPVSSAVGNIVSSTRRSER